MPDYTGFFAATAGAAAALVGLLFVAVSISPERTVGEGAPLERQMVAEGSFTALTNAFFIALAALIPGGSLGWVALVVGASSLWHALGTGWRMAQAGGGVLMVTRRLFYVASNVLVYGLECIYASQILGLYRPPQPEAAYGIAYVLLGVIAIGLSRAWQLLGAPRRGFLAWLSPLQPEQTKGTKTATRAASVSHEATNRTEPPAR